MQKGSPSGHERSAGSTALEGKISFFFAFHPDHTICILGPLSSARWIDPKRSWTDVSLFPATRICSISPKDISRCRVLGLGFNTRRQFCQHWTNQSTEKNKCWINYLSRPRLNVRTIGHGIPCHDFTNTGVTSPRDRTIQNASRIIPRPDTQNL